MTKEPEQPNPVNEVTDSPGTLLKVGREKAGLSIQEVADKLFLKVSTIREIEQDQIDTTKSFTFTKGYVRNYARLVGLDTDDIIAQFDTYHKKPEETAKLQSFSKRVAKQAQDDRWMMVTYALLFLLIAAVVLWWYQQPDTIVGEATVAEEEQSRVQPEESAVTQPIQATSDAVDTVLEAAQTVTEEQDASNQLPEETDVIQAQPDEPLPLDESEIEIIEEEASNKADTQLAQLVFTFAEDCWVNIEDATGEAIAYGVKAAGRVMELEGLPPFEVTLGAPQVVQITYNGEQVDMSGFTGREIGRLTLPNQE